MRLITYTSTSNPVPRSAVRVGHRILDIEGASRVNGEPLPSSMKALLQMGRGALARVRSLAKAAQSGAGSFSSAMLEEKAIRFLPPVPDADKFLCVGPDEPTASVKLNSSFVGHDARVPRPAGAAPLDYEPQLVFVIGKRALGVKADDDAFDYVVGITLHIPGFGPLGPEIVTMDEVEDPYDLWITCSVNGEERMRMNTRDQLWKLPDILEHFSRDIPVQPGDMFSTGGVVVGKANAEALQLKPGDVVECGIEGLTTLRATIVAA